MDHSQAKWPARALGFVLVVLGLTLAAGGIWLVSLGGSVFYVLCGLAWIAAGALLLVASPLALWLYAATLAATLVWAIWEVGLDWWQLAPRGALPTVLGILIALPWVVRGLKHPDGSRTRARGWIVLGAAIVLSAGVGAVAMISPSNDLKGALPTRQAMATVDPIPAGEWRAYGRTSFGDRYSPLSQLIPGNVGRLDVAWSYHTGDFREPKDPVETTYEVTPLKIGDTLYLCTPHDLVIALDAETGAQKWRFDPKVQEPDRQSTQHLTCRGVSYDDAGVLTPSRPGLASMAGASTALTAGSSVKSNCNRRLFLPTVDGRLIAISADTGTVCPGFGGSSGTVNLWQNMPNVKPGSYYSTSPPVIAGTLIILGGAVNDNVSTHETSGVVRAFDKNTGALVWNWDSMNPDQTAPIAAGKTYSINSPNSWAPASYDPALGLIYLPMGNQPPDQFGGRRDRNVETYSSAIVALHADTGKVAWVFQGAHHDLWDMDIPAQPSLVDLTVGGRRVPALVAPTKQGEIFVLDRRTGVPLLPITEVAAPKSTTRGDFSAPTQPQSALSFNPKPLTEASMWGITPFDQLACRIEFRQFRYAGRFTPPSTRGSIIYPGNFGTFNWGGVAVDPERQIVFAVPVYLAFTSQLFPRPDDHTRVVTKPSDPPFNENFGAPYAVKMVNWMSPLKLPCQAPPWGYVAAADLTTGKIVYQHRNGTTRDLSPIPLAIKMGVPAIGGPMITKGGLAFLSGTLDYYVRAYDLTTGVKLWQHRLPAGGQATPMTYWSRASNRQFVVVVAGGHGSTGTKAGDSIIAYALPKGG